MTKGIQGPQPLLWINGGGGQFSVTDPALKIYIGPNPPADQEGLAIISFSHDSVCGVTLSRDEHQGAWKLFADEGASLGCLKEDGREPTWFCRPEKILGIKEDHIGREGLLLHGANKLILGTSPEEEFRIFDFSERLEAGKRIYILSAFERIEGEKKLRAANDANSPLIEGTTMAVPSTEVKEISLNTWLENDGLEVDKMLLNRPVSLCVSLGAPMEKNSIISEDSLSKFYGLEFLDILVYGTGIRATEPVKRIFLKVGESAKRIFTITPDMVGNLEINVEILVHNSQVCLSRVEIPCVASQQYPLRPI